MFPKIIIHIWIQQFYFGRKQKYLWKHFYNIKKPLKNRASFSPEGKSERFFFRKTHPMASENF